jgi:hypothetical protein
MTTYSLTVNQLCKSKLADHPTFTTLLPLEPANVQAATGYLRRGNWGSTRLITASRFDGPFHGAYLPVDEGKLIYMTAQLAVSDVLGGSLGDSTANPKPMVCNMDRARSYFVGIANKSDIDRFNLPYVKVALDELHGKNDEEPNGTERFSWELSDPNDTPHAVLLPLVLPIPAGLPAPAYTDCMEPPPAPPADDPYPVLYMWQKSIHHIHRYNDSASIGSNGCKLFKEIDVLYSDFDVETSTNIVTNVHVHTQSVCPMDSGIMHKTLSDHHESRVWSLLLKAVGDIPPPPTPAPAPAPTPGGQPNDAFAESLASAFRKSKADQTDRKPITHGYSILTSHRRPGQNGASDTITHPELGEIGRAIISASSASAAATNCKDLVQAALLKCQMSSDIFDNNVTLTVETFDAALCGAIRDMAFLSEPINQNTNKLGYKLSLVHFGPLNRDTAEYNNRLADGHEAESQERTGIAAKQRKQVSTSLYHQVTLDDRASFIQLLCNIRFLIKCLDASAGLTHADGTQSWPIIWEELFQRYFDLLNSPDARCFASRHRNSPQLWYNLVVDMHVGWMAVLRLATTPSLRLSVSQGISIPAHSFEQLRDIVNPIRGRLLAAIYGADDPQLLAVPALFYACRPNRGPPSAQGAQGDRPPQQPRAPINPAQQGDTKRQRTEPANQSNRGSTPDAAREKRKALGMLTFAQVGARLPRCNLRCPHPNKPGKVAALCLNFLFKGYACGNSECNFIHLTHPNKLPAPQRDEFRQWVADTAQVDWVKPEMGTPQRAST